ncbi:MAG TPA: hypothetical protein VND70_05285 [Acidimicrobiales bacterium]|nr:hypothetical protein [Acidimicrobiales bacterium]
MSSVRTWLVAALAAVMMGWGAVPASASQKGGKAHAAPKLVQVGHRTFWECSSKTTSVLIVVNKLTLHPGDVLTINFVVRNQAAVPCDFVAPYAGAAPGPTSTALQVGPCGSMGFAVLDNHHRNVWPGVQTLNCPALGFAQLHPNATVSGAGSWAQVRPRSTTRVPAGNYTLLVDGHCSFPLQVAAH